MVDVETVRKVIGHLREQQPGTDSKHFLELTRARRRIGKLETLVSRVESGRVSIDGIDYNLRLETNAENIHVMETLLKPQALKELWKRERDLNRFYTTVVRRYPQAFNGYANGHKTA